MSSPLERLNANLISAADAIPAEELAAAKRLVDEQIAEFTAATHPSQHPDVVAALAHLREASAALGRALARAHEVVNALARYADKLALNHPVRRTLPPVPAAPASTGEGMAVRQPEPSESSPSPEPPRPPARVEEIGRNLPVRMRRTERTTGSFNGETIVSGRDRSSVADLRPSRQGGWPEVLLFHVESHVAARMRRHALAEGELVLNNVTCGNRGYDNDWPVTCEKYLRSILPAGAQLTVWATPDGGRTWWNRIYVGTGERIKP